MMAMLDPRDQALLAACPVVAAPRFGKLPEMANGQRIIVARNGWFVQTRLDWLDSITALGLDAPAMRLPYGEVQEHLRFSFGPLPIKLIEEFVAYGREHLPNEVAGVLIYSRSTGRLRLEFCDAEWSSPVRIDYRRPPMARDETVAVDLHTHGRGPAFWSADDDRDDPARTGRFSFDGGVFDDNRATGKCGGGRGDREGQSEQRCSEFLHVPILPGDKVSEHVPDITRL